MDPNSYERISFSLSGVVSHGPYIPRGELELDAHDGRGYKFRHS